MKWLLIITLFGDSGAIEIHYQHTTEAICEQSGKNYMARYEEEGAKAEYECIANSPFILSE